MTSAASKADPLARLRRAWWIVSLLAVLLLLGGFLFLSVAWSSAAATGWAALTGIALSLQLAFLWRGLAENHPPDDCTLWSTLGPANLLTISRGFWAAALTGLLALPLPPNSLVWLAAIFHAVAVAPDFFDGYIARITGRVSVLGGRLDMEFDALAMLAATLLAVNYGFMPWWFITVGLARYLYVFGLWSRSRRSLPIAELPPSTMRRPVAGLMMGFANLALWPVLDDRVMALSGLVLAGPLLAGFARDWLVVSGRVNPASLAYTRLFALLDRVMSVLLPGLRILGGVAALLFLLPAVRDSDARVLLLAPLVFVAAVMFALGAAARIAALVLLAAGLVNLIMQGAQPDHVVLALTALPVLLFGPGRWALWKPEEPFFSRPIGRRRSTA